MLCQLCLTTITYQAADILMHMLVWEKCKQTLKITVNCCDHSKNVWRKTKQRDAIPHYVGSEKQQHWKSAQKILCLPKLKKSKTIYTFHHNTHIHINYTHKYTPFSPQFHDVMKMLFWLMIKPSINRSRPEMLQPSSKNLADVSKTKLIETLSKNYVKMTLFAKDWQVYYIRKNLLYTRRI